MIKNPHSEGRWGQKDQINNKQWSLEETFLSVTAKQGPNRQSHHVGGGGSKTLTGRNITRMVKVADTVSCITATTSA